MFAQPCCPIGQRTLNNTHHCGSRSPARCSIGRGDTGAGRRERLSLAPRESGVLPDLISVPRPGGLIRGYRVVARRRASSHRPQALDGASCRPAIMATHARPRAAIPPVAALTLANGGLSGSSRPRAQCNWAGYLGIRLHRRGTSRAAYGLNTWRLTRRRLSST